MSLFHSYEYALTVPVYINREAKAKVDMFSCNVHQKFKCPKEAREQYKKALSGSFEVETEVNIKSKEWSYAVRKGRQPGIYETW